MTNAGNKNTLKIVISTILVGVAAVIVVPRLMPKSDAARTDLLGAMCYELAEEVGTLTEGPATIVCIGQANSRSIFSSKKALGIFRSMVEQAGHKVVAEEYIPLEEMLMTDQGIHLKPSSLQDVAGQHQDATVVVSFVGEPRLEAGAADPLAGHEARLVVVSFGGAGLAKQLDDQVVDLALVFSEETPLTDKELGSPEEIKQYISFQRAGE